MAGEQPAGYVALGQMSSIRARWWQRFPTPIERAALRVWESLPRFVRAPLVPLGRLFGPHTVSVPTSPGPDTVSGVADLVAQGFDPVENHTGAVWVAALWPDEHRRSVRESRSWWLDDQDSDGQLWLIRSPWPSLTLHDVFDIMWRWVERDRTHDDEVRRARVAEVLGWTEATALQQLAAADIE